jgi:AcrR family transcriptional regulator
MNEPLKPLKEARTSRAEAKAERRRQLVDATIESIARFGLTGTTMGKVTELAGVSLGLANFHFDSKDRLFEAVLQHLAAEQRALWRSRAQDPGLSSRALLLAIVESRFHATMPARNLRSGSPFMATFRPATPIAARWAMSMTNGWKPRSPSYPR